MKLAPRPNPCDHGVHETNNNNIKLNISKAAGPDLIPGRMLNMLAPVMHASFTQSLDTGELPRDWSLANVAPIFKEGNRSLAENNRLVSLTCITC